MGELLTGQVAAVSAGLLKGIPHLDLDYSEDSTADVDFNVVMTDDDRLIEVQGTAEHGAFTRQQMDQMVDLAAAGIRQLFAIQRTAIDAPRSE
jgi:ribonuclease PH